jgi:hypothetical protein
MRCECGAVILQALHFFDLACSFTKASTMPRTSSRSLLFAATLLSGMASAQQVQWLTTAPINWFTYPSAPGCVISARDPEHVYVSRLNTIAYTYTQPMGPSTLSRQGADGVTLWSVILGDTVQVENMASDDEGNVVVGGRYFHRLRIDGSPVLAVPAGHSSAGSFLCMWNADGQLLWQQDVSGGAFEDIRVSSITFDQQGRLWAALNTFFEADIVRLNTDGTQAESRTIVDSKLIGSISFDPWGGLYVSGAAGSPDITVNGIQFVVPHDYAFFVTRMNAAGEAQWVRTAEDITFQEPLVVADESGHAILLGNYFEPLEWGTIPFADPLWGQSFFLTRLDSLGNFDWGVAPPDNAGSGQFRIANGSALGVDAGGNSYVLGNLGGSFDWGNGVTTGSGTEITDKSIALMSFDDAGLPRWGLDGGSMISDAMYGLAVAENGTVHIAGLTNDPFTLGPFTADPGATRGSIVARVDQDISTDLSEASADSEDLVALPSVFSTSFRLASNGSPLSSQSSIELIDATGRIVQRARGTGAEWGQALAPGCYTVVVHDAGIALRTRVVKE